MSAAQRRAAATRGLGARRAAGRLLWLAAAVISGFTLRRYLGPLDEGILMQAATRMADGQWPWRDFGWSYGPGEPLVVMARGKLFDPSLLWWRLLRVAADATAAVLVYALVRDERPRWAFAAWAAAAVIAAQPTSANPTAPALAFALAAVLLATRGHRGLGRCRRGRRRVLAPGRGRRSQPSPPRRRCCWPIGRGGSTPRAARSDSGRAPRRRVRHAGGPVRTRR